MILNICDRRKRPYRWRIVNAIVEPTWHDNSCQDSDQALKNENDEPYAERNGISLVEALKWASDMSADVTLYIYDEGDKTKIKLSELSADHPLWRIEK